MKKIVALLIGVIPSLAFAQRSYEVDPQHYKLLFQNECVEIIRGRFGPGESNAAPYQTLGGVVVNLTDASYDRVLNEGNKTSATRKAGDAWWAGPGKVKTIKNTGDKPIEFIAVVPKGKAGCEK